MRRDKTFKVCANHFIKPTYELKKVKGSEKAFIYMSHADFADEVPKSECFAIRFSTAESILILNTAEYYFLIRFIIVLDANKFKDVFNESTTYVKEATGDSSDENKDENITQNISCEMNNLNLSNTEVEAKN